jgi:hypothetical protein
MILHEGQAIGENSDAKLEELRRVSSSGMWRHVR